MKKKDIFFACLFMVCFLVSAIVMAGDYLYKMLEKDWNDNHVHKVVDGTENWEEVESGTQSIDGDSQSESSVNGEQQINADAQESHTQDQGTETLTTEPVQETETAEEPEEKPLEFQTVGYDYFDDALFIGDSRTVGIMEYGGLENAAFFADSGMSIYGLALKKISVPDMGKVTFDEILEAKQYGKIYLMLGMNELGYRFDTTKERYQETVEKIRAVQADAVIYLCANMHVTQEQSEKDEIYNNENVNKINEVIASLADGENIFYLDVNELFDDETGSLDTEYTSDAFHVLGIYYVDWVDWLCTKAIVMPEEEGIDEAADSGEPAGQDDASGMTGQADTSENG